MLGLDNPLHIAFILVLLLLVFGAKRLPEMGKSLGAGLRGFKESISGDEPMSQIRAEHDPAPVDAVTPAHVAAPQAPAPAAAADPVSERSPAQPVA